jgi:flagellar basal-body rod modification protein FlgD
MTGVEQQLLTNDLLKKLVGNTASGVATAVSLIGKEVRAVSSDAALAGGEANWTYALDRIASDVKLEILDSRGRVVRVIAPTDNKAGEHQLTWDGKGDGGSTLPDGVYSLRVTAKDTQGTSVASRVYADGIVTGVEQADGQTLITINGAKVSWDKVTTIRQPAEQASTVKTDNPDDKTSSPAAA